MSITITNNSAEGVERRIRVSVSVDRVQQAKQDAARRVAKQVRVPGFRAGKAPLPMVTKQYAPAIEQEALEKLMREAYDHVITEAKLEPVTQPHAHDVHFTDGEPLTFELHCEVRPEVTLTKHEGFTVTRASEVVTAEMLDAQIEQMREQRGSWAPADGKPAEGDLVAVDLAMPDESGAIGEGKEYRLVLGAGQAIPAIEEVVMTLTAGATAEQPVRWPDDFPDEAQRGKTKTVRVTLKELKRKALPALDDAFAREMGEFDSVDAMKAAVRKDMEESARREADAGVRGQLVERLVEANPFAVPPSWVKQLSQAYAQAYGIPEAQQAQFAGEFASMAERQVRRDLIVDAVATAEGLTATEADVDTKVEELATARGLKVSELYASLQKAGRLREIERGITEDRVFAWLLARNTVESQA
ncbi:MAG: trigger factor [Gemmatimonadaceae bacterium]|nr:trigger factor [Gemmatimonadaceae bacterium]